MILAKDHKLWLPDGDTWCNWSLGYESTHWKVAQKYIRSTRLAIDVGAHVGIWSIRLAQMFNEVQAFEPLPKHIECFNKNLFPYNNVHMNPRALSSIDGVELTMSEQRYRSGSSTFNWKRTPTKSILLSVKVTTLDTYGFTGVDFLKIDVEGHEKEVLEGAKETLKNNSPVIFLEVLPHLQDKSNRTALDVLSDFGYEQAAYAGSGNYVFVKDGSRKFF